MTDKLIINKSSLEVIADAIREKSGKSALMSPAEMRTEILALSSSGGSGSGEGSDIPTLTADDLVLTGDCEYMFHGGCWDWFIEKYGDKITTKNITLYYKMFQYSNVERIPFDINTTDQHLPSYSIYANPRQLSFMFNCAEKLRNLPYIKGNLTGNKVLISRIDSFLEGCHNLTDIPEDWADYISWDTIHNTWGEGMRSCFLGCYSLRHIPESLIKNIYTTNNYSSSSSIYYYSNYYYEFCDCYVLEEVSGLPVTSVAINKNQFSKTFSNCHRLKKITFETDNGTPKTASWCNQTIDLSDSVGYVNVEKNPSYRTHITDRKDIHGVTDYSDDVRTCYFNRASCVELFNSLPDTSSYLASAGGSNVIKLRNEQGEDTAEKGVNQLLTEQIAIAASKGWTISYVEAHV